MFSNPLEEALSCTCLGCVIGKDLFNVGVSRVKIRRSMVSIVFGFPVVDGDPVNEG